jgi:hypothetical protein
MQIGEMAMFVLPACTLLFGGFNYDYAIPACEGDYDNLGGHPLFLAAYAETAPEPGGDVAKRWAMRTGMLWDCLARAGPEEQQLFKRAHALAMPCPC